MKLYKAYCIRRDATMDVINGCIRMIISRLACLKLGWPQIAPYLIVVCMSRCRIAFECALLSFTAESKFKSNTEKLTANPRIEQLTSGPGELRVWGQDL